MSTITWITARGLFGRRRFLLLLPLPLVLLGLAVLCRSLGVDPGEWGPPVLVGLGLAVVLPVVALIIGTGVLGAEIDDGTVVHILTKPLPRWQIVLPKLAVAAGVTAATVVVPLYVAGVLAASVRLGLALAVAAALGALAYSALFLALSLVTRRPVLLGLVYVLIWEGLLGNFVSGTKVLSIQQYVIALADRLAPTGLLETTVSVPVASVMTALVSVGFTVLAIDRLRSFSVAGETS
ncbi:MULTISPECIES: ABC transporter permease subunit [Micromonospora]|jgi:ABC-2 type transport system permease protein|uniref:ABC transporter permease subunit n=1 Tax=Micromonospora TaxID=1873 RepID=UPI00081FDB64|nr:MULTISPECIES: ABC transporter permease subunit [Micromonospora]MBQ0979759.1 ABC transporter permease subunit [Micromonospora sp. M61]MBQ1040283.1 ABC transporter permease subunit [Micromonospora sp. C81]WTE86377.1 ABC transporter permease subunit [Micromonospora zamorensis]WTI21141.1 ABC transporter permease subunit [Micromonospora zamorensis]SCG63863.1 ABC-2 type transport system permease protein [Micromonospora zamorensis]